MSKEKTPHPARALIEPGAKILLDETREPVEHEIELSKAISLKRIADALSSPAFSDLEHLAYVLGTSFERGRRVA